MKRIPGPSGASVQVSGALTEEVAAIAAALGQFTGGSGSPQRPMDPMSRWQQAALHEGVRRAEFDLR
jgi:hypothetical protein